MHNQERSWKRGAMLPRTMGSSAPAVLGDGSSTWTRQPQGAAVQAVPHLDALDAPLEHILDGGGGHRDGGAPAAHRQLLHLDAHVILRRHARGRRLAGKGMPHHVAPRNQALAAASTSEFTPIACPLCTWGQDCPRRALEGCREGCACLHPGPHTLTSFSFGAAARTCTDRTRLPRRGATAGAATCPVHAVGIGC